MNHLADSSTRDKDTSLPGQSPHSELERDQSSTEQQVSPERLPHPFAPFNGLTSTGQLLGNPFSADASYTSATHSPFNPLGLLQPVNPMTSLSAAYSSMDTLSMASALQAATLGLYPSISETTFPSWSKYYDPFGGRKRKQVKTTNIGEILNISTEPLKQKTRSPPIQPSSTSTSSGEKKDESYWDRRRKNNEAAKRSRDARRLKEEEVVRKAHFLQQENTALKAQISILRAEFAKLQYLVYNKPSPTSQLGASSSSLRLMKSSTDV